MVPLLESATNEKEIDDIKEMFTDISSFTEAVSNKDRDKAYKYYLSYEAIFNRVKEVHDSMSIPLSEDEVRCYNKISDIVFKIGPDTLDHIRTVMGDEKNFR